MIAKDHPAVRELLQIIRERDWTEFCPEKNREILILEWIEKWFVNIDVSQNVVNTGNLTSEASDLLKVYLAQKMAEELAEECSLYSTKKHSIGVSMMALRRKKAK